MYNITRAIQVSRPFLWPAPILIFLFAVVQSGQPIDLRTCFYAFLWSFPNTLWFCSLNDLSDYSTDRHNTLKGGVSGAKVLSTDKKLLQQFAIISGAVLVVSTVLVQSAWYIACALLGIILGYIYSFRPFRLKERPILDSLSNGVALTLIFLCGYFFHEFQPLIPEATQSVFGLMVGTAALHIIIAIRDIEPDRKAGMTTTATLLGAKRSSLVVIGLFIILFFILQDVSILFKIVPFAGIIGSLYLYLNPTPKRSLWVGLGVIVLFSAVMIIKLLN